MGEVTVKDCCTPLGLGGRKVNVGKIVEVGVGDFDFLCAKREGGSEGGRIYYSSCDWKERVM